MPLSRFYNLKERNQGIRDDTDRMTTLESTKILVAIPAKDIDSSHNYKIIGSDKKNVIIEFEYDLNLKDFIDMISSQKIEAEFYQVDAADVNFDETDKINVGGILDLMNF